MSTISTSYQSFIGSQPFTHAPINWENHVTPLDETNMNNLSRAIDFILAEVFGGVSSADLSNATGVVNTLKVIKQRIEALSEMDSKMDALQGNIEQAVRTEIDKHAIRALIASSVYLDDGLADKSRSANSRYNIVTD